MAEYLIQDKTLKEIANAIRSKTGSTETIYTKDMATHIYNIEIGSNLKCPVLDETYPQSVSINATESASFEVRITEDGSPNSYTYQWYYNGNAVSGATSKTYIVNTTKNDGGTHLIWCEVTNEAGIVTSSTATLTVDDSMYCTPVFTYDGRYVLTDDSGTTVEQNTMCDNWKLKFKTGGTLTFTKLNSAANGIDVFCVGGGGASGNDLGGGGGGGYTQTESSVMVNTSETYDITIGAGGRVNTSKGGTGGSGGYTSAFGMSVSGGFGGKGYYSYSCVGGDGGSGGGGGRGGIGGQDGADGSGGNIGKKQGGKGQGATTREFGESTARLYASGGNGTPEKDGNANTGDGGSGGSNNMTGGNGGSGIVIIRNKR